MEITISQNIRIHGLTTKQRGDLMKMLTQENPAYLQRKLRRKPTYGIDQYLHHYLIDSDGSFVAPRGFEKELENYLRTTGETPSVRRAYTEAPVVDFGTWSGPIPREYQQPAIMDAATKGGVLVSPAGSGKTLMGFSVIQLWRRPTLWLTHTLDLLTQSARAAEKLLDNVGKVGIIADGKADFGDGKLIVATVQTLAKNPKIVAELNTFIGAVVVDEAHHMPATHFIDTVGQFKAQYLLGLTATPDRKDGLERKMLLGLGPICHKVERDGMYEAGAIILPEVKFIYTEFGAVDEDLFDLDEPKRQFVDGAGEDLDYSALTDDLYADEARRALILETINKSVEDLSHTSGTVIVLSQGIRYLRELEEAFNARFPRVSTVALHGSLSESVWVKIPRAKSAHAMRFEGYEVRERKDGWYYKQRTYTSAEMQRWQITPAQREKILADVMDRKVRVLFASFTLVKEGLDIPHLAHGHLVTPMRGDANGTHSGAGVEQALGRIMRPDPETPNKRAVWYDYVDYHVGVFKDQYQSRRAVYRRLGIKMPAKKRSKKQEDVLDFLKAGGPFGDLPI